MVIIDLAQIAGSFAENKDAAQKIRREQIIPALKKKDQVVLDFTHVRSTTQSFIHALISEAIREVGSDVLDKIYFKNCNENVQEIINIVVEYMQA